MPNQCDPGRLKKPSLSLSMIVKNEERFLEGCLQSVAGIVDEIVIADTGSTDRSRAIAENHGAKVIDFAWTNDFSAARNASLSHATGDWVLSLDADERLVPGAGEQIRSLLSNTIAGAYTLLVGGSIELAAGRFEQLNAYPRLFRRHPLVRFEGVVHEQIAPSLQRLQRSIVPTSILIEHLGYAQSYDVTKAKCYRNILILRQQLRERPENDYARFQLGNSLAVLREYTEARTELARVKESHRLDGSIKANIFNLLAEVDVSNQDYDAAVACYRESLKLAPRQTMARWFMSGVFLSTGRSLEAVEVLEELLVLLRREKKTADLSFDLHLGPEDVYRRLALGYAQAGRRRDAAEALFQGTRVSKGSSQLLDELLVIQESLEDPSTAIRQLEQLCAEGITSVGMLLRLTSLHGSLACHDGAEKAISRLLNEFPADARGYEVAVQLYLESSHPDEADRVIRKAESGGVQSFLLSKTGLQLALRNNDIQGAFHHLENAFALLPAGKPDIRVKLEAIRQKLRSHPSVVTTG